MGCSGAVSGHSRKMMELSGAQIGKSLKTCEYEPYMHIWTLNCVCECCCMYYGYSVAAVACSKRAL